MSRAGVVRELEDRRAVQLPQIVPGAARIEAAQPGTLRTLAAGRTGEPRIILVPLGEERLERVFGVRRVGALGQKSREPRRSCGRGRGRRVSRKRRGIARGGIDRCRRLRRLGRERRPRVEPPLPGADRRGRDETGGERGARAVTPRAAVTDLGRRAAQQRGSDAVPAVRVRTEQRAIAERVDEPRDAAGEAMHGAQRPGREDRSLRAGHFQAAPNVLRGLRGRERPEVVARRDALRELAQIRLREQTGELGLPDQEDLEQLLFRGLEIGEQAHLLEHLVREPVRLVDDDHRAPTLCMVLEQEAVQCVDRAFQAAAALRARDAEVVADRRDELLHRKQRIENERRVHLGRQPLEQCADHHGLARADLARQLHEAAALADAVEQMRERLLVAGREVEVARIRGEREGIFPKPEVARVHQTSGRRIPATASRALALRAAVHAVVEFMPSYPSQAPAPPASGDRSAGGSASAIPGAVEEAAPF